MSQTVAEWIISQLLNIYYFLSIIFPVGQGPASLLVSTLIIHNKKYWHSLVSVWKTDLTLEED